MLRQLAQRLRDTDRRVTKCLAAGSMDTEDGVEVRATRARLWPTRHLLTLRCVVRLGYLQWRSGWKSELYASRGFERWRPRGANGIRPGPSSSTISCSSLRWQRSVAGCWRTAVGVECSSFVGLFIPVWWAWAGFTFYADRYDTDDVGQRLLTIAQMCTIVLMAASVSGAQADSSVVFALSYVGARTILNVMYFRAGHHVPETRQLVTGYIRGDSVATLVWVVSVFVPSPARFVLWGVGLAISFYTPYAVRKIQAKVPLDTSHLPERMGLFIILVFGESIAAVVAGLAEQTWAFQPTLLGRARRAGCYRPLVGVLRQLGRLGRTPSGRAEDSVETHRVDLRPPPPRDRPDGDRKWTGESRRPSCP